MSIKLERAVKAGKWFKGAATSADVVSRIPKDIVKECPSRIVALVGDAIDKAYHDGRASTGAEIIDGNVVWVYSLNRGIEWDGELVKFVDSKNA